MSNHTLDQLLYREHLREEHGCCECGFYRAGAHHPAIKCPTTGRCGTCGGDWPCRAHRPPPTKKVRKNWLNPSAPRDQFPT